MLYLGLANAVSRLQLRTDRDGRRLIILKTHQALPPPPPQASSSCIYLEIRLILPQPRSKIFILNRLPVYRQPIIASQLAFIHKLGELVYRSSRQPHKESYSSISKPHIPWALQGRFRSERPLHLPGRVPRSLRQSCSGPYKCCR